MSEIPENVTQAAFAIIDANSEGWSVPHLLERAIIAERERCAAKAEEVTKAPSQRNSKSAWEEQIGRRVSDAIRSGE